MAVWWSKGNFSFLSIRVCVHLKIMAPKGKQNYVRCITKRAREFTESSRKKNERVGERVRELLESSGSKEKKRRGCTNDGYTCVVDKMQEKKKRKKEKET